MPVLVRTRKLSTIQRKMSIDAVNFVCKKFMPRMNLKIVVKGVNDLLSKYFTYGECAWTDDNNRPREFEVRIDTTLDLPTYLETLMHELVHVKQYAKGELGWSIRDAGTKWHGKLMTRNMDYYDYPWEIEAQGLGYSLTEQFLAENKRWNKHVKQGFTDYKLHGSSQMVFNFSR